MSPSPWERLQVVRRADVDAGVLQLRYEYTERLLDYRQWLRDNGQQQAEAELVRQFPEAVV